MARRTIDVKIEEKGRDQGKLFRITEMSAFDTEEWSERVINACLRNASHEEIALLLPLAYSYVNEVNQVETLDETQSLKNEGKAAIDGSTEKLALYFAQIFFSLPYGELKSITEPLLNCCDIYLNPAQNQATEKVLNNPTVYIEEPATIFTLKREVFKLHTDFFTQKAAHSLMFYMAQNQVPA